MRFLTQRITGVQRFAYEICCELDKLLANFPDIETIGLLPNRQILSQYDIRNFSAIKIITCGRFSGHLWEQLELPWYSRGNALLNLCNVAPIFKHSQYITLHDVIFMTNLDSQKWWFKRWYQIIAKITLKSARHVFTVSEFSKAEISRLLNVPANRITVLGNAPSLQRYPYVDNIFSHLNLYHKKYFLMIGSNSVRKNTRMVAQLFADSIQLADSTLVIVGGEYVNLGAAVNIRATNIIYTGYIDDGELRSLYREAQALIFPSIYEGFGIPVIEAMAEDCQVIVADIPVMREICGMNALFFDPLDLSDLESKLTTQCLRTETLQNCDDFQQQYPDYHWSKLAQILFKYVIDSNLLNE